ncbi:post-GPI attachment to proteins factor 2-like [Dreissena polymorpha]|uniref:post-GPI attachment to proteins factor 2-like n=1 Tax=Dreissena polymorpha TaxID=45954 RepID=UPI0022641B7C|nr:post-GPI attachment to proteins factor 2-like [Dreissena polymorpha]
MYGNTVTQQTLAYSLLLRKFDKTANLIAKTFLPMISTAIGGFTPQRYVWTICISLTAGLRFLLAYCYFHWHLRVNMDIHEKSFIPFIVCSEIYMIMYVYSWFALCEYLTVFSNIAFHSIACVDFSMYSFTIVHT